MVKKLLVLTEDREGSPIADWLIFAFGALSLATAITAAVVIA